MTLYIIIIILTLLLSVTSYFCFKFAFLLINVQESVGECIEVMDDRYESIDQILSRPLFYDSQEVRQVLEDIKKSREAIFLVAKSLSKNFNDEQDLPEGQIGLPEDENEPPELKS